MYKIGSNYRCGMAPEGLDLSSSQEPTRKRHQDVSDYGIYFPKYGYEANKPHGLDRVTRDGQRRHSNPDNCRLPAHQNSDIFCQESFC